MNDDSLQSTSPNLCTARDCNARVKEEVERGGNASAVIILDQLINEGYLLQASDIHINPTEENILVKMRVDGVLQMVHSIPKLIHNELITRLKVLCGLRTDEHQAAMDGRLRQTCIDGIAIDIRVSIMPLYYGENAILRLLVNHQKTFSLSSLGFCKDNQEKILVAMKKPYGMILVTGPTGSGKTTTLYTLLSLQNATETSIVTIEDPIEYAIKDVNQIQVNPRTGLTFAHGLRSILRQDPNTIMVGEIRDVETAGLAVNIALTGHIVVSTLHTNDAATTLPRLLDMKIEPYLIASTVNIAIGQRLVRRLCSLCKKEKALTPIEVSELLRLIPKNEVPSILKIFTSVGCKACNQTGFSGRIGIHEVLVVTPKIRTGILERLSAAKLRAIAIDEGMTPLITDGFNKVFAGITTIEEVLKINYE
ncbi:GspE/PulE family protein [Patescibacteria group bacterium]|nr:GspE/PulE family protein [Patescibacteria group bacterium]